MKHSESRSQQALIRWWNYAHKGLGVSDARVLMAFPLQGARTAANGARMKSEGMRTGTPDLFLAVPRQHTDGDSPGLFIEMKRLTGKSTEAQQQMQSLLSAQGYRVEVCHSTDEAIRTITEYLKS